MIKKIKKNKWKILLVIVVLAIVIAYTYSKYKNDESNDYDYTHSIYVMTKNANNDGNDYYEVNNERRYRRISNFMPDKIEKYTLHECFTSYADIDIGKIMDKYSEATCTITDDDGNTVEMNDTFRNIINVIVDKLYNKITDVIIYKVNDHYYTTVMFKLSTHDSYKLYYYSDRKLEHIVTFNDKYVINIKEKEPFIFAKDGN